MTDQELAEALAEPFAADEIKWKPQAAKGDRALAVAYIDARCVMDRLDEVVGVGGWKDEYRELPDGNVLCRLWLRAGGEWVAKEDVGGESEQPDGGDRCKAAHSDALKRAAVKWGVGRYLYRLPQSWVAFDAQKRRIPEPPRLPAWALPRPKAPAPPAAKAAPANGHAAPTPATPNGARTVEERLRAFEAKLCGSLLCKEGDLLSWLRLRFGAGDPAGWPQAEARAACVEFEEQAKGARPVTQGQLDRLDRLWEEKGVDLAAIAAHLGVKLRRAEDLTQAQAEAAAAWMESLPAIETAEA